MLMQSLTIGFGYGSQLNGAKKLLANWAVIKWKNETKDFALEHQLTPLDSRVLSSRAKSPGWIFSVQRPIKLPSGRVIVT